MPKIGASLADISTKVDPIPNGDYLAEITEVDHSPSKSNLPMISATLKIANNDDYEPTARGRLITERFTLQQKNGEPNEAGMRQLKRLIVAACGEDRANDENFDTDELKGQIVHIVVKQEPYTDEVGDEQMGARIRKILPIS